MPARRRATKPRSAYQSLPDPAPGLHLRGAGVRLRVEALANDLLHLQWTHGASGKPTPSWVVQPWTQELPTVQRRVGASTASLTTRVGTFSINLKSGAWTVTDTHGLRVFTASAGASSTDSSFPPRTGAAAMVATRMSGRVKSIP